MEVHHHPHVEKKSFKEYFLEFLMIFLAVTMGFFAEQVREYFADKAREKEYLKEIVANLEYDSIRIDRNIETSILTTKGMDSLRDELKQAINGHINSNMLYYLEKNYAGRYGEVAFNTSAITELKNSGSLRIISNKKIVADMSDYYERRIMAAKTYRPSDGFTEEQTKMLNEFFSWKYFDDQIRSGDKIGFFKSYDYSFILTKNPPLQLLKSKPEDLEKLYNMISQFEYQVKQYDYFLLYAREQAVKLISDIRKEYDSGNE